MSFSGLVNCCEVDACYLNTKKWFVNKIFDHDTPNIALKH